VSFSAPSISYDEVRRVIPHGSPSKKQAVAWGLNWPLQKGWRNTLPGAPGKPSQVPLPTDAAERFALGATATEIENARSPAGGFTAKALAELGVAWPPVSGWRTQLISNARRNGRV
jgi:hypothetical protein